MDSEQLSLQLLSIELSDGEALVDGLDGAPTVQDAGATLGELSDF